MTTNATGERPTHWCEECKQWVGWCSHAADRHYLEAVAAWDRAYVTRQEVREEFPHLDPWKQKDIVDERLRSTPVDTTTEQA